jgi:hypothetical protein
MVTSSNFCYSISAAARILGVSVSAIAGFQVWTKVVWVWVKGCRPQFLSMEAFKQHFVERRRIESDSLQVFKSVMVGGYIVRNEKKDSQYICTPYSDSQGDAYSRIECSCEDFKNQVAFNPLGLSRRVACCKHVYATLAHLGYTSLREYIIAQAQVAA